MTIEAALNEEIEILRADAATMQAEMTRRKDGWRRVAKQYRWDRNQHLIHGVRVAPDHVLMPDEWVPTWSNTRRDARRRRARREVRQ